MHLTVMRCTAVQQGASVDEILAINDFVLRKFCPNISHKEFIELDSDLDHWKGEIMKSMMVGFNMAIGREKYDFGKLLGSKSLSVKQVEYLQRLHEDIKDKKIFVDPQVIKNMEETIRYRVGAKKNEKLEDLEKRLRDSS